MPRILKYEFLTNFYARVYRRIWRILFSSNFKKFGKRSYVSFPLLLQNTEYIEIGDDVSIARQVWLGANFVDGYTPSLIIDNGTRIGNYNHIVSVSTVYIGKYVLTADKVFISDSLHSYKDISKPISQQPLYFKGSVHIGDGTWLGECVAVIGAKIGKHCIIGANSVVTRDIPDYCVAVGSPAKVIKTFDSEKSEWVSVLRISNVLMAMHGVLHFALAAMPLECTEYLLDREAINAKRGIRCTYNRESFVI